MAKAKSKQKNKTSSAPLPEADFQCRLYLISPPQIPDLDAFAQILEETLAAGDVAAFQIRLKDVEDDEIRTVVQRLLPIAHAHEVAVVLNDRADLAAELGCDGAHLGQDDTPYAEARALLGDDAFVGVTCHDSRHLGMEAAEAGADYVAFGAFFPSSTKETEHSATPDLLTWWQQMMTTPCVAIGGITLETAPSLVAAGADFIAVSNAVWSHPDGPAAAVRAFNAIFE